MNTLIDIYWILIYTALLVWSTFAIWLGTTRTFTDTKEGINAFVVSVALVGLLGITVAGSLWRLEPWVGIIVLILLGTLVGAGIQRLWFLWTTRKKGRRGLHE